MPPTLRLFAGPDSPYAVESQPPSVTVTLGDLLGACGVPTEEHVEGRVWLCDFADEPVTVSADLADLMHAARNMDADNAPPGAGEPARRAA
ncbi:hypothetical protein [Alienimonas chondri]|uniref:Uncharacterized protein n=1 Tax=Alienimonas chondri TaxID=2681879 RepID=A0ABX1VFK9_9PLAN|nr:hypothetical protein [Alienimonas chondri]NNJ26877.1 hypothetical protein [Alienimonas chondri]